jgi:8-oxo-dGTP pyrophosphatase MutT (NUDIX family)
MTVNNLTLDRIEETLVPLLNHPGARKIDHGDLKPAAVCALLLEVDGEPAVLITRRSNRVRTHQGQASLPGGGWEEGDEDGWHTAWRETEEETGVPPDRLRLLGRFDDYISIHGHHVQVYVARALPPLEYILDHNEVDYHIEVPLKIFLNEDWDRKETVDFRGEPRDVYFYTWEGTTIWGLTARILTDLARLIRQGEDYYSGSPEPSSKE